MFQFKQFTIEQDQTAMKVCTDACILGAYTPVQEASRVLDIGTGTGLLALMLAQRNPNAQIDAVEIESNAYFQAKKNIENSPFSAQIQVFNQAIQYFAQNKQTEYDLIISNPPFFTNHLKSSKNNKNQALHTNTLSFDDLLKTVKQLLLPNGTFVVLLPEYEMGLLQKKAEELALFQTKKLLIKHHSAGKIFRVIAIFELEQKEFFEEELFIKNRNESYSSAFINLLKDYYLIF